MIFEKHVNGPENPGQIQYKDAQGNISSIAIPEIVWAFESDAPLESIPSMPGTDYVEDNMHALYIVTQDRNITAFKLTNEQIQQFLQALKESNPNVITEAFFGRRLPLQVLSNCRDLGGIETKDGRLVIPHKLLRSDELHKADKHDKEILLDEEHLKTVIDLRTDWERLAAPDPLWLGVKFIHDPVIHEQELGIDHELLSPHKLLKTIEDPENVFVHLYKEMVLNETGIKAWKKFFEILLEDPDGAILFHCTQGKDRTGIAAMLLLAALNVDLDIILDDYYLTTTYLQPEIEPAAARLVEYTKKPASDFSDLKYLFDAEPAYIQASLDAIKENYGSIEDYLEKAIGLSQADLEKLRSMYLTGIKPDTYMV